MRQNILFALLGACCALLLANLATESRQTSAWPPAIAQSDGGSVVMAASNTQNEAFVFVYNTTQNKLAAYSVKGKGITYKGVRSTMYDFKPTEYPRSSSPTAVKNMAKALSKLKDK